MKAAGDLNLVALSDGIDLRRVFASPLALLFPNRVDPHAHHLLPSTSCRTSVSPFAPCITASPVPLGHSNARHGKGCSVTAP